jgi:hypothetical protein
LRKTPLAKPGIHAPIHRALLRNIPTTSAKSQARRLRAMLISARMKPTNRANLSRAKTLSRAARTRPRLFNLFGCVTSERIINIKNKPQK